MLRPLDLSLQTPAKSFSPPDPTAIAAALEQLKTTLRPGQRELALWQGGPLAVSAVPGAGKSYGMAVAAAITLAQNSLQRSRQLILVTFTRSAAANLKTRIRGHLQALRLPQSGFAVHTLHGLALNIASRHPDLSGLNLERVTLVSPFQSHRLLRTCVDQWVGENPGLYQQLLEGRQFDGEETERLRRQSVLRTEVLPSLAQMAIHEAKSSGLSPEDLQDLALQGRDQMTILAIAAGLYAHYQRLLRSRNYIDYDEMILAALRVLAHDPARQLWQQQVFAVFEDEAQDSTPLQTRLLEILATSPPSPPGSQPGEPPPPSPVAPAQVNLVRVGDPNQAINSTFTPADPSFFREFCERCDREGRLATMAQAGRSSPIIIAAANFVLEWVNQSQLAGTEQPFRFQQIQPVVAGDPQADANPAPEGQGLEICTPRDIYQTIALIGQRVIHLLGKHPDHRAAVLVRENKQGRFLAEVLSQPQRYQLQLDFASHGIEIYDVGSRDRRSQIPAEIFALLQFLDRPHSPDCLKSALSVLMERQVIPHQDLNLLVSQPEQFLYPGPLDPLPPESGQQARQFCCKLLRARLELPHYQLISFLALALQYNQAELATADKLTTRIAQQTAGNHTMSATLQVLQEIINSERFDPVELEDTDSRYVRARQLTIITMHKAKGLDWDYVFLPFLHEHSLPGSLWVPAQAQFLGDFTLAEVARAQIRANLHGQFPLPDVETAWKRAADLKTAEEFRLLYVAMTRAKRLLWMSAAQKAPFSWANFDWHRRDNLEEKKPCPVLRPLQAKFPQSLIPVASNLAGDAAR